MLSMWQRVDTISRTLTSCTKYDNSYETCIKWLFNKLQGCSESDTSYFIMSAHDIRGGCWQYGSRG